MELSLQDGLCQGCCLMPMKEVYHALFLRCYSSVSWFQLG